MTLAFLTDTVTSDLDRALHYAGLWAAEAVELRTVGGEADRVPHVNEEKLKRRLWQHELAPAAIVPMLFEGEAADRLLWMNELAVLDEMLAFCRRIGCPLVVASSFAADGFDLDKATEALRRAGDRAAKTGRTLAVLNSLGGACPTAAALGELLNAVDHPHVGAAWSPADALRAGEEPATGLASLTDRILLVRAADGRQEGDEWTPTVVGDGHVGWDALLPALCDAGFDGPVSLEVDVEPQAKTGLRSLTTLHRLRRQQ